MDKTKIILFIEGGYPWHRGGVPEWVHQYLKHSTNYEFTLIQVSVGEYRNKLQSFAPYEIPDNVSSFIRIPPPNILKDWKLESARWLADIRPSIESAFIDGDIVHLTNTGVGGWLGIKMALLHGKPIVLTEHALYRKEVQLGEVSLESGMKVPESSEFKSLFINMLREISRKIYQEADQVISVSQCNIPFQKKMGAKAVKYIPNGIGREWLLNTEKDRNDQLTIGWVGRCSGMKNPLKFLELINAFETKPEVDVSFLMLSCDANEPALAQKLKAESKKYPQLTLVWNRSAEQFFDEMDALCITSLNESQPLVLFEALSRKVLPVGWKAGDATNKYGFFVPTDTSAHQLMEQLINKWQTPREWKQEVNQKFNFVAQHHLWGAIFKRYHGILDKIKRGKTYA